MERPDNSFLLHLGVEDDDKNGNGVKAQMTLLAGEGRNEQERGQGEPACAAAAAEGEGEKGNQGEESYATSGDAGPVSDGTQKQEQQPLEQPVAAEGVEATHPLPLLVRRRRHRQRFTLVQLQELERKFQSNHYISRAEGMALARLIGATEDVVQKWFKKRREQYRRYKRL